MKTAALLFPLFSFQYLGAQITFQYGIELGANTNALPYKHTFEYAFGTYEEAIVAPIISPLIGGFCQLKMGKHFSVNSSLNYTFSGHTKSNKIWFEGSMESHPISYSSRSGVFTKINAPFMLGYHFKLWHTEFQIRGGCNFNYFISARNFESYFYYEANDISSSATNPFDIDDYNNPAERWSKQAIVSAGADLNDRMNISISAAKGWDILYFDVYWHDQWDYWSNPQSFDNMDYSLTLKYDLKH
ncbi:MAG: hypothetical protein ACHQFW_05195 [Chitinophagales bacterium]